MQFGVASVSISKNTFPMSQMAESTEYTNAVALHPVSLHVESPWQANKRVLLLMSMASAEIRWLLLDNSSNTVTDVELLETFMYRIDDGSLRSDQ